MKFIRLIFAVLFSVFMFSSALYAETPDEERAELLKERQESLSMLYKEHPNTKGRISSAYGYATFQNWGINLLLISTERGSGVAHNNKTGKDTFMKMFSGGVGPGLGVKDFRAILIFDNKEVFDSFVESGWEANAQADAAAQSDGKGAAADGSITVVKGMTLYQLTKNGLALQATIQGTKYWIDEDLN